MHACSIQLKTLMHRQFGEGHHKHNSTQHAASRIIATQKFWLELAAYFTTLYAILRCPIKLWRAKLPLLRTVLTNHLHRSPSRHLVCLSLRTQEERQPLQCAYVALWVVPAYVCPGLPRRQITREEQMHAMLLKE